jgi:bifunctional non-homologous end joining protein LigD
VDAAADGPLPELVRPMLAVPGELPPAAEDDQWRYEMKWDGVRAVAYVQGGSVRLMSRNDLDVSRSYPEVLALPDALRTVAGVVDGELVTFDAAGRPSFGRLQERMHVADVSAARRLAGRVPVVYLVFDVLHLRGASTLRAPYVERRALLEELGIDAPSWRVPPSFPGPGADVLAASAESHLEGVVAKRAASTYRPGARSPDWRKVKLFRTQEVVIGGWRPGRGRREGMIGSLILGVPGPAGLRFAGGVGTGFTEQALRELAVRLRPLARDRSPFAGELPRAEARDAHWVAPELVGEVVFSEWTSDGRLRQPSWRGLRPDKSPEQVHRETSRQTPGQGAV